MGSVDLSDRLQAVRDLVEFVRASLVRLTSREEDIARQFAAVGLARNNRLLSAMLLLHGSGFPDVCGMPLRPLIEQLLVSLYCLFGGRDAYEAVRGSYVRSTRAMREAKGVGTSLDLEWHGPLETIVWEQLTRDVGALLEARGEGSAKALHQILYNDQYRATSAFEIHGGVGPVGGHLIRTGKTLAVSEVRVQPDDGSIRVIVAGSLQAFLAHYVFETFGLSTAAVDRLQGRILNDMELAAQALPDDPDLA
jgi:hypothetical protein